MAAEGIRYAAHGLVAAWADHARTSAELLDLVGARGLTVARTVEPVDPGLAVAVVGSLTAGAADASWELAAVAATLSGEARALLALLFADPSLPTVATVLPPPGHGLAGIASTFPPGVAHDYVDAVLTDQPASLGLPVRDAAAAPVTSDGPLVAAVIAVASQFDPALRRDVAEMFLHASSHAIQVHGPYVADEALQARITWRKDPAGRTTPEHVWTVGPDDTVTTEHRAGAVAGRFDSLEALAKPLKALIEGNGGTIAGLHAYLKDFPGGRAKIFVPASLADLRPGETTGFRGAGARTPAMASHWRRAREYAMATGSAPMPIVATDQIADGSDPGAAIIFRKVGSDWVVVTCYPSADEPIDFVRFGGSIP